VTLAHTGRSAEDDVAMRIDERALELFEQLSFWDFRL
jgi:hypothetical protein